MPLINTQSEIDSSVEQMLNAAGIVDKNITLANKLVSNGLGVDECVEQLADIARNGDSRDAIRLRAIETGLKLNGALKEADKPVIPAFTIIINDPSFVSVNPILIPR